MSDPAGRSRDRQRVEQHWHLKYLSALARYRRTAEHHRRMVAELGEGTTATANGAFAVASARRARAWAHSELVRVQQIYKDLVDKGIPPPHDEEMLL